LPKVKQLIIISRQPQNIDLPNYQLYPLDFEEFLNFTNNTTPVSAFNQYTKLGSLPRIAKSQNQTATSRAHFFEQFDAQDGKVILILALFQCQIATAHQIYQKAKESFKISKDLLYKTLKNFKEEKLLIEIETIEKGFGKKQLIYDFAFAKYLNKHQPFITTFDSLVALALIKHKIKLKASTTPLAYLTNKNHLIMIAPFEDETRIWQKIQTNFGFYTKLKLTEVTIVTINSNYSFKISNIKFTAMPFYEWIVGL